MSLLSRILSGAGNPAEMYGSGPVADPMQQASAGNELAGAGQNFGNRLADALERMGKQPIGGNMQAPQAAGAQPAPTGINDFLSGYNAIRGL